MYAPSASHYTHKRKNKTLMSDADDADNLA